MTNFASRQELETQGVTLWFTGLPCSGKSTLANLLHSRLRAPGLKSELLDGDVVRQHLTKGLGFSKEDRDENIRRIGFVCHLLTRNGVVTIAAAISPYRSVRDEVRQLIGSFAEIYVNCPLEVCIQRDVKGMYKKALRNELPQFTGISAPYESPLAPEITLETGKETVEESVGKVLAWLKDHGYMRVDRPGDISTLKEEAVQQKEEPDALRPASD